MQPGIHDAVTKLSMRKYLALLILVMPINNAFAGYYFSVPSQPKMPFGMGRMELIPHVDTFEPVAAAHDYCMQAATSALIRFDDRLRIGALSRLPQSPVAPPSLPIPFPAALPLKGSQTFYQFPQNRCVRGYDSTGAILVDLPEFERFYAALMTCARIYGYERVAAHALCVSAIAGNSEL